MANFITYANALRVVGPDGTTRWVGHGWLANVLDCVCGTGTTAVSITSGTDTGFGIAPGDFVKVFNTSTAADRANGNTELQRWTGADTSTTTGGENANGQFNQKLSVRPVAAAADVSLLGVALTGVPVKSSATAFQHNLTIAGYGSIINCNTVAGAHTVGLHFTGSATVGAVQTIANAALVTAGTGTGTTGGIVVKANTADIIGTGSTTQVGVLVSPW